MKKLLVILILFACIHPFNWQKRIFPKWFHGSAHAADCGFEWKASAGATGYWLEYSLDQGATWTGRKATGSLVPNALGYVSWTYTGVPETGLVLFRVAATNATSTAIRLEAGAWYHHAWRPLPTPSGAGISGN